jgi:hypothetical protein
MRRILVIMRLIEHVAARLRERLQGAPVSPSVDNEYNLNAEAESLIEWMGSWEYVGGEVTQKEADTLCDEGESGNPRESYN